MTERPRRTSVKPAGKCIFCEGGAEPGNPMTKEHIWSNWMAPYLPGTQADTYYEFMENLTNKVVPVGKRFERYRQGGSKTKRVKAVCKRCNSGWMSVLETKVRPTILPLMKAEPSILDLEARRTLVEWVVLKTFIAEQNTTPGSPPDSIFEQAARSSFKKD